MDNTLKTPSEPSDPPRPRWQIWGARIGVVVMIVFVILYYIIVARGGL